MKIAFQVVFPRAFAFLKLLRDLMLRKLKIPNDPLPCYYSQKFPEAPAPKVAFFLHFLRVCTQLGRFFLLKFSSADPKRNWKYG